MRLTRLVTGMLLVGIMALRADSVSGQAYPSKLIRILTTEPGAIGDVTSRIIGQGLTDRLGQQITVDNRPSGVIPGEIVAKAPPDGYTLLVSGNAFWIGPLLEKAPYDPVKDFSPISLLTSSPNILVVHPAMTANSVQELIALAKASPGVLNYGSTAAGGANHLAAELFKAMAGVNIVRIPYKSPVTALNDMIGGAIQLMFATTASSAPHIRAGRLRPLAVTSAQPFAPLPGVPTVAAAVPGYEAEGMIGVFAPAGIPAAIIARLNQEIAQVLGQPDVKAKFSNTWTRTVGSTPEQFAAAVNADMTRMGRVIKDAGIRAD